MVWVIVLSGMTDFRYQCVLVTAVTATSQTAMTLPDSAQSYTYGRLTASDLAGDGELSSQLWMCSVQLEADEEKINPA